MKTKLTLLALSLLSINAIAGQAEVDAISKFDLNYAVKNNFGSDHKIDCAAIGADWASCNLSTITLTNKGEAVEGKDWAIYFHNIRRGLQLNTDEFKITHITGDLHKIEPTEKFKGFAANSTTEIPLVNEYWQILVTDVLPRWYVASEGATAKVIENTNTDDVTKFAKIPTDNWKRNAGDLNVLQTPVSRFEKNSDVKMLDAKELTGEIFPTPTEVISKGAEIDLSTGINISGLNEDKAKAATAYFAKLGVANGAYKITTSIDASKFTDKMAVSGAYTLKTTKDGAQIVAFDEIGAYYGVMSIASMLNNGKIAEIEVKDAPRYAYRGHMIDVGRNFHSKAAVLAAIEQMAAYKLNKLHFHLTDDEGWRLEIPGLPELTEIGAKRAHDLTEQTALLPQLGSGPTSNNFGSGFLTKAEYIEIVKFANARGIEVIPEIDMPAHSRAAIVSMEARYNKLKDSNKAEAEKYRLFDETDTSNTTSVQFYDKKSYLNPCLPSSLTFVDKVVSEVIAMHKEAGQELQTWHFGGDEAKNIKLGGGYADKNDKDAPSWKGKIDQTIEDKPWAKSVACQAFIKDGKVAGLDDLPSFFATEVSKVVKNHGINTLQTWQDGLKEKGEFIDKAKFATDNVNVNVWETVFWGAADIVADLTGKGYNVVLSNPDYLYFDFPYEINPAESGYYWGARFIDERKIFGFTPGNLPQNAEISYGRDGEEFEAKANKETGESYGLSLQNWSEIIRTDEQLQYMEFPRLLVGAEKAWHKADFELDYKVGSTFKKGTTHTTDEAKLLKDWTKIANILGQRELPKLDKFNIQYRVPQVGAKIIDGLLEANIALPGVKIEYSTDGEKWMSYDFTNKPKAQQKMFVRATANGRYSKVEEVK